MSTLTAGPAALVVAHPGHELRLHAWLEQAQPRVQVLTDGSGGAGSSRLASTARLLDEVGATPGGTFGPFADRTFYAAILGRDYQLFTRLVADLAADFLCQGVRVVAGDAAEGYNPSHDVCRLLIDAAVVLARAESGLSIANYAFTLVGHPTELPADCRRHAVEQQLDDAAFTRKCQAAASYAELQQDIAATVDAWGWEAFRHETLYPVEQLAGTTPVLAKPYYERYGEQQVQAGRYRQVLRYREHILPLCEAVWRFVERRGACRACAC